MFSVFFGRKTSWFGFLLFVILLENQLDGLVVWREGMN